MGTQKLNLKCLCFKKYIKIGSFIWLSKRSDSLPLTFIVVIVISAVVIIIVVILKNDNGFVICYRRCCYSDEKNFFSLVSNAFCLLFSFALLFYLTFNSFYINIFLLLFLRIKLNIKKKLYVLLQLFWLLK